MIILLSASSARAGTVDFFRHDGRDDKKTYDDYRNYSSKDNDKEFDWTDNKNKSDWSNGKDDDNKNNKHNNNYDRNYWHDKDDGKHQFADNLSHYNNSYDDDFDFDDRKHKDGHISPPICATADLNHHEKDKGGDEDGQGRFGRHFHDYYEKICDHDGPHWRRHCEGDPGDPLPLPGALWLFMAGLILLTGFINYHKTRSIEHAAK